METGKLPLKTKLGYGVCDLGGNLFFTVIGLLLLNFLTDTVGITAALAGIIIAVGKVWDAVTDPMAGYLSDRTVSRWGRRRPWILFGSLPLFAGMVIMFTNPGIGDQTLLFVWGTAAFCFLCTAYTAVNIPYNSLTPELTQDYHERTSLNGFRFGFAVIGTLMAAGAALPIVGMFSSRSAGFTGMGTIFGAIMMVTALITFFSVREPDAERVHPASGVVRTYLKVFKNGPFVLIMSAYTLHVTALTVVMGVAIYYFKYIHLDESKTTAAMLILLMVAMVFIPVSVALSKKAGKKMVYGAGMFVLLTALIILFLFGHVYSVNFSLGMMTLAGAGLGFTYAMPWSMVPDAVEYDYLLSGERTEGSFYGIWTFGIKIGQAVALAISGAVLSISGYIPNMPQSASSKLGIRLLLGPIPAVVFLLGILVLYFYPLTEEKYNEVLAKIKEMDASKG